MAKFRFATLVVAAVLLASCDGPTPEERRNRATLEAGDMLEIARIGEVRVFQMTVRNVRWNGERGTQTLYYIPGGTTVWEEQIGKTTETRAVVSPAFTGLSRLTDAERAALGLPPANDPRVTGLAKLTDEEKRALGVEQIERDLLRRRPE